LRYITSEPYMRPLWRRLTRESRMLIGDVSVHRPQLSYCRHGDRVDRFGFYGTVANGNRCRDTCHYYTTTLEMPPVPTRASRAILLARVRTDWARRHRRSEVLIHKWRCHARICQALRTQPRLARRVQQLLSHRMSATACRERATFSVLPGFYDIQPGRRGATATTRHERLCDELAMRPWLADGASRVVLMDRRNGPRYVSSACETRVTRASRTGRVV